MCLLMELSVNILRTVVLVEWKPILSYINTNRLEPQISQLSRFSLTAAALCVECGVVRLTSHLTIPIQFSSSISLPQTGRRAAYSAPQFYDILHPPPPHMYTT